MAPLKAAYQIDACEPWRCSDSSPSGAQIAWATTNRRTPLPDRVIAVLTDLYAQALKHVQP